MNQPPSPDHIDSTAAALATQIEQSAQAAYAE